MVITCIVTNHNEFILNKVINICTIVVTFKNLLFLILTAYYRLWGAEVVAGVAARVFL